MEINEGLPGVLRSTVSAERRFSSGVARRVLALGLLGSRTGSSAVRVGEARIFDVLGSFPTDLVLRGKNRQRVA